jgi:hypothetical protein
MSSTPRCCCWPGPDSSAAGTGGSARRSGLSAPSWPKARCSTGSPGPASSKAHSWPGSFWLIDALVRNGHAGQGRKLWHGLTGYASDLGLFAEEIDPATGAFLGNMPQGLSHLALLNAPALLDGRRG